MLIKLKNKIEQEKGKLQQVKSQIEGVSGQLKQLQQEKLNIEEANRIISLVAQQTQSQLAIYLDDMVTAALQAVFPDDTDWSFKADFVQRRGQTEVDLMLSDAQGNRIRPADQDGGGLVDVVAFVLRVALWSLSRDTRPVIILDEPWRNLHSKEYHGRVAQLVRTLSDRLGLQFIIITGAEETEEMLKQADMIIEVTKKRGVSTILQNRIMENHIVQSPQRPSAGIKFPHL